MLDHRSYGDILRSEREYAGIDLATMSKRLHIRPDILGAIENSDFGRMPARGYSKNMIRAYARALGLDERRITDMYLDEVHLYEVGSPRNDRSARRGGQTRSQSRRIDDVPPRSESRSLDRPSSSRGRYNPERPARRETRGDAPRSSRSRDINASPNGSRPRGRGQAPARGSGRSSGGGVAGGIIGGLGSAVSSLGQRKSNQGTRVGRSYDTIGSTPPYARTTQPRRGAGGIAGMSLPLLLAIVAVIIVLIIAIVVVVNGGRQSSEEVPNIPISGLTDTSSPEDDNQVSQAQVAPQDVQVTYTVASGQDAWMEIYKDGSETPELAEVVSGPASETFTVTGSLTIRTANPDAVTVSVDGQTVQLTKASGSNYYSYTVDFAETLRQWQAENSSSSSSSSSASSSSSQSHTSG